MSRLSSTGLGAARIRPLRPSNRSCHAAQTAGEKLHRLNCYECGAEMALHVWRSFQTPPSVGQRAIALWDVVTPLDGTRARRAPSASLCLSQWPNTYWRTECITTLDSRIED